MRSLQLDLSQYDSDKVANGLLNRYDPFLEHWVEKKITLLELGVLNGSSLLLWRDYFPQGTIVGIDRALPRDFEPAKRVRVYEGSQDDPAFLTRVANEAAPDGFDIIIDDASHIGALTRTAFWHLFDNHLKPGGLYAIEDWGTGYWDDWCDGRSLNLDSYLKPRLRLSQFWLKVAGKLRLKLPLRCHSYGMVGVIKQLIDEQGASHATKKRLGDKSKRRSKFDNMAIFPLVVFIKKAGHQIVAS